MKEAPTRWRNLERSASWAVIRKAFTAFCLVTLIGFAVVSQSQLISGQRTSHQELAELTTLVARVSADESTQAHNGRTVSRILTEAAAVSAALEHGQAVTSSEVQTLIDKVQMLCNQEPACRAAP